MSIATVPAAANDIKGVPASDSIQCFSPPSMQGQTRCSRYPSRIVFGTVSSTYAIESSAPDLSGIYLHFHVSAATKTANTGYMARRNAHGLVRGSHEEGRHPERRRRRDVQVIKRPSRIFSMLHFGVEGLLADIRIKTARRSEGRSLKHVQYPNHWELSRSDLTGISSEE